MGPGFPPLAERLALVPGSLSPALAELAVQFGAEVPFDRAARLLVAATGTAVPAATIQRLTERVGAAWCQLELSWVEALETAATVPHAAPVTLPDAVPVTPATVLQLSVDGAMVPLVHGEWTEARTAAIGEVVGADDGAVQTQALSYVSHVCDAATFGRLALVELTRRGVGTAGRVVAINDGADWIQTFLDLHRPDAVRILDFAHAAGYLAQAAQAAFGPGTAQTSEWFARQRHELRHGEVRQVVAALRALPPSAERDMALGYLTPRLPLLAYPDFATAGYPIGSGCVESANKVVIEARLKGAGMHWTRAHADALVGLRTIVGTDRWAGCWARIGQHWRTAHRRRAAQRRQTRAAAPVAPPPPVPRPPAPAPAEPRDAQVPPPPPTLVVDGHPTPAHPWKRTPACATKI